MKTNDLIYRQAALDALAAYMPSLTTADGSIPVDHDIFVAQEACVDCIQIIHELPSAQPDVPEKNVGEWILLGCGWARCSQCGVKHINVYDDDHWYNFCPHCGAKMEGVKLSVPLSTFTRTLKQK